MSQVNRSLVSTSEDVMKIKLVITIVLLMLSRSTLDARAKGLPFINDNFEKALAEAKQQNVPLFVDVWAPW